MEGKSLALLILSGRQEGTLLPLQHGRVLTIGRMEGLDLVLPEDLVSRRHAQITVSDDGVHLRDLGSTNGTFVNGKRVREVRLAEGDRVLLGATILSVVAHEEMLLPSGSSLAEALTATVAANSQAGAEVVARGAGEGDGSTKGSSPSETLGAEERTDTGGTWEEGEDALPPDAELVLAEGAPPLSQLSAGELDLVQAVLLVHRVDRVLEKAQNFPDARALLRGLVDKGYLAVKGR